MAPSAALSLKRNHQGLYFLGTEKRLVIRPTAVMYLALLALLAAMFIWPSFYVTLDEWSWALILIYGPAVGFAVLVLVCCGRWLTFDRERDAVRWFPRTLCRVSQVRSISLVRQVRRAKRTNRIYYHLALDLADGTRVRLPGLFTSHGGNDWSLTCARTLAEWLNVEVREIA